MFYKVLSDFFAKCKPALNFKSKTIKELKQNCQCPCVCIRPVSDDLHCGTLDEAIETLKSLIDFENRRLEKSLDEFASLAFINRKCSALLKFLLNEQKRTQTNDQVVEEKVKVQMQTMMELMIKSMQSSKVSEQNFVEPGPSKVPEVITNCIEPRAEAKCSKDQSQAEEFELSDIEFDYDEFDQTSSVHDFEKDENETTDEAKEQVTLNQVANSSLKRKRSGLESSVKHSGDEASSSKVAKLDSDRGEGSNRGRGGGRGRGYGLDRVTRNRGNRVSKR